MPGKHEPKVDQFLKASGLSTPGVLAHLSTVRNPILRAIAAREVGDARTEKSELSDAFEAIDLIDDGISSSKNKSDLKKAIAGLVKKLGKPQKKRKTDFRAMIKKNAPAFKKILTFAKKGDKKKTDAAVAQMHRSMREIGEVPDDMSLDVFYTNLGKYQSDLNEIRRKDYAAGREPSKGAQGLKKEISKIIGKLKFPKSHKLIGCPTTPKTMKSMREIAMAITRVGVTAPETLMYASEAVVNYADFKKVKGKNTGKLLAQSIHDELAREMNAQNIDALI